MNKSIVFCEIVKNSNDNKLLYTYCNSQYNKIVINNTQNLDKDKLYVCYNFRNMVEYGVEYVDVGFFKKNNDFTSFIKASCESSDVDEYQYHSDRVKACLRACKEAKIDTVNQPLSLLVPEFVLDGFIHCKLKLICGFFNKLKQSDIDSYIKNFKNQYEQVYQIEKNGVFVDLDKIDDDIYKNSVSKITKNNFTYTKFNISSSKTGRLYSHSNYFNCASIPKKPLRQAFRSRFDDGVILSFDFNAIDYRCIMYSLNCREINDIYENVEDFHTATTELVFGKNNSNEIRRNTIKKIFYSFVYGSSVDNIVVSTGLSKEKILLTLDKLDAIIKPLSEFKKELCNKSLNDGYVTTILGAKIPLTMKEHIGQILALYAQANSNHVFLNTLEPLQKCVKNTNSKITMLIHDEIVLDVHQNDILSIKELKNEIPKYTENIFGRKFPISCRIGENYWEIK